MVRKSTNSQIYRNAASALSDALKILNIPHAFIGGFALNLYGSNRQTIDIDVILDIDVAQINDFLRPRLIRMNKHFVQSGLKFYFAPDLFEDLTGDELIAANSDNVQIETLAVRTLGLPVRISTEMIEYQQDLPVLHSSILILTKLNRWGNVNTSTFPPRIMKARTDLFDILFIINSMIKEGQKIDFTVYHAERPDRLDKAVKDAIEFFGQKDMTEERSGLLQVMTKGDQERLGVA